MVVSWTHGLSLGQRKIIQMWSMTLLWQSKAILIPDSVIFSLLQLSWSAAPFPQNQSDRCQKKKILQSSVRKKGHLEASSEPGARHCHPRSHPACAACPQVHITSAQVQPVACWWEHEQNKTFQTLSFNFNMVPPTYPKLHQNLRASVQDYNTCLPNTWVIIKM